MKKTNRVRIPIRLVSLLSLLALTGLAVQPSNAQRLNERNESKKERAKSDHGSARDDNWVKGSVIINAPPHVVWEAVHEERQHDPDLAYSKLVPETNSTPTQPGQQTPGSCHEYRLEQKFVLVPVLGTAVCQMHNKEVPFERIDYKLIKSDRFKEMEGSWVLSPEEGGKTKLELSSLLDTGMPVPRGMVNSITARKIQKRLKRVKDAAETLNLKLAERSKHSEQAH